MKIAARMILKRYLAARKSKQQDQAIRDAEEAIAAYRAQK